MNIFEAIKGMWDKVVGNLMAAFNSFIQQAIPPAKQILIAEFKDISVAVVKELSLTNLTSDAKRAEAIKRITDAIISNGKEASQSLVRLLVELAYSAVKESNN